MDLKSQDLYHAKFLNWSDKEFILHRAPSALKDNPLNASGAKIIVTDDVSKKVWDNGKLLKSEHLPDILEHPDLKVPLYMYVIPARIKYKRGKYFVYPSKIRIISFVIKYGIIILSNAL